jgi:hypothetical protein
MYVCKKLDKLEDDLILRQFEFDLQVAIDWEILKRLIKGYAKKPFKFSKSSKDKFIKELIKDLKNDR